MRQPLICFCLFSVLAACVTLPKESRPPAPKPTAALAPPGFPQRIAILPSNNKAGNMDGAILLRHFAARKLTRDLGYYIEHFEDIDSTLENRRAAEKELPIQVYLLRQDPKTLAAVLGAEGLLYSELLEYSRAKLALYVRSAVKIHLWLVDASGKRVWESTGEYDQGSLGGGGTSIESYLSDGSVPEDIREKARNSELSYPLLQQVEEALSTFPRKP